MVRSKAEYEWTLSRLMSISLHVARTRYNSVQTRFEVVPRLWHTRQGRYAKEGCCISKCTNSTVVYVEYTSLKTCDMNESVKCSDIGDVKII